MKRTRYVGLCPVDLTQRLVDKAAARDPNQLVRWSQFPDFDEAPPLEQLREVTTRQYVNSCKAALDAAQSLSNVITAESTRYSSDLVSVADGPVAVALAHLRESLTTLRHDEQQFLILIGGAQCRS